jgi:hypothetical protein
MMDLNVALEQAARAAAAFAEQYQQAVMAIIDRDAARIGRALAAVTSTDLQDVIVSHNHISDSTAPWSWRSAKIPNVTDPRYQAGYGFKDCESAANDAEARGHTVVEVRE